MAMTMTREQGFIRAVGDTFYGAAAQTAWNGQYDFVYRIRFRTGAVLENTDPMKLMRDAWTYYLSTYRLTGEYP